MDSKVRFLIDDTCGKIVEELNQFEKQISCCGQPMKELKANTSDGATEKHVPLVEKDGRNVTVKVGSIYHPMTEEHSIAWVYLQTKKGGQRKNLCPAEEPIARFVVTEDDEPIAAYAYCNLHGFWKTEVK